MTKMMLPTRQLRTAFLLTFVIGGGPITNPTNAQEVPFEPVRIERERSLQLAGTPDQVFPLFEPKGQRLWTRFKSNTEFLFPGSGETLSGAMFRIVAGHGTTWEVVAQHDPQARMIRYVHLEPDVELLVEEIRCVANPHGGTIATIKWSVAGLTEDGNERVRKFMTEHFDEAMDRIQSAINAYLKKSTN